MNRLNSAGLRLGVATAVVLAVTAGGLAAPALAAGPAVTAPATSLQRAASLPPGAVALSGGPTGFLSRHKEDGSDVYTWTRYDGTRTTLPGGPYGANPGTDTVVRTDGTNRTFLDMATGEELVSYDLGGVYVALRFQGTTLIASKRVDNRQELHLLDKDAQGRVVDRTLTGLPQGMTWRAPDNSDPDTLLLHGFKHTDGVWEQRLALVDLASASVTATYDVLNNKNEVRPVSGSRTHVVWQDRDAEGKAVLAVTRPGSREVSRSTWEGMVKGSPGTFGLAGDWAVSADPHAFTALGPEVRPAPTARSLTTGETVQFLAHATSLVPTADGGLIATGGTVEHGEGVYRITPGPDGGRPTVSVLATTGVPTAVTGLSEPLAPSGVIDLDQADGHVPVAWTLSRANARVHLKLVHTATGTSHTVSAWSPEPDTTEFRLNWDGLLGKFPAYRGAYTWTMRAEPANGIGPALERTGSFTVTRAPRPHDFDDNGSPDIFSRSSTGVLSLYDVGHLRHLTSDDTPRRARIGGGWNTYDRIVPAATGLVARDTAGVLWSYEGKGDGTLTPRKRVGGGWKIYDKLTSGSDLTGDGRNDLLATDKTGVLWLYPSKGDGTFSARKRVGGGWSVYNQLTATGNLAGAPAGDLVARDKSGVLWLYLGKGDGTFAPRTRISGGWSGYQMIGPGDIDGDGWSDVLTVPEGYVGNATVTFYYGTGQWRTPFPTTGIHGAWIRGLDPLL
ncbi:FG-GAP-like repeat-containing protein [Streptomyces sp. NBC_01723]|uniref:FG-GAP repeat domain-containing protein n=1 Tax=Streptomyces sp. NBC_01723 TaxID=2975921 RepID=UPI002E32389E|nr:VCBS repeat-containing protein [Streptomyces sp. NBC_01723]